jgi:hypothetical protein
MTQRSIGAIARDIRKSWTKPYFGAVPYIAAMHALNGPDDKYGADDAKSIVLYFLANATTWRGNDARKLKAELKQIIGVK